MLEEVVVDLVVEGDHLVGELASRSSSARIAPWTALTTRWPISWSCASIWSRAVVDRHRKHTVYSVPARRASACNHFVTTSQRRYSHPPRPRRTLPANP